jgi:hypothetical protein
MAHGPELHKEIGVGGTNSDRHLISRFELGRLAHSSIQVSGLEKTPLSLRAQARTAAETGYVHQRIRIRWVEP